MRIVWSTRVQPAQLQEMADLYLKNLTVLTSSLADMDRSPIGSRDWTFALNYASKGWTNAINAGKRLVPMLMGTVVIPPSKVKKFESAARTIIQSRSTRNIQKWAVRNLKHLQLIAEAATDWEIIGEDGGDQVFPIADFDVINTLGLVGKDLDPIKIAIARAFHGLKNSGVVKVKSILRGEVHLVGKLRQAQMLAWYDLTDDSLYIRPFASASKDATHSLIHELGHRYWNKYASRAAKSAWRDHHSDIERKAVTVDPESVDFPEVGETVEMAKPKGRGKKRAKPSVVRITGESPDRMFWTSADRYFSEEMFLRGAQRKAQWDRFPTAYSSQDPQEHFCEALALYARGNLDPQHAEVFEEIWT